MTDKPTRPDDYSAENIKDEEQFFERYLQGRSSLSELYQQADIPEPSAELDQGILTAAKQQVARSHWWYKPGSWAATIAVFSLIALLAHNTWQSEQDYLQRQKQQQAFPDNQARTEATIPPLSAPAGRSAESQPLQDFSSQTTVATKKKEARKPGAQPAPVQAFPKAADSRSGMPARMILQEQAKEEMDRVAIQPEAAALDRAPITDGRIEPVLEEKMLNEDMDARKWLTRIEQLLNNQQMDEARRLYRQFQKKYPNYPVDPVILQQLSP